METRKPFFYDVTLRDGNQALKTPWNTAQKEQVFRQLLKLGVQGVEVGFAGASDMDFEACEHLARLTASMAASGNEAAQQVVISGLARAVSHDIEKVAEAIQAAPHPRIHTFIAMSPFTMENVLRMPPEKVRVKAVDAVRLAKSLMGDRGTVQFSAEHFGDCRDNMDWVIDTFHAVIEAGATTINLPNTVERYRPMLFVDMVRRVAESLPKHITIAVHTHNDLGMATATTVESFFAGATQMEVALNGLGERAGNTNFHEVAVGLYNCGVDVPLDLSQVYETALLVSKWSEVPIYQKAPLVGSEAVAHRSGIHQDGAAKTKGMTKGAYRPIDFALIGRDENDVITFTSQSGKTAVFEMLDSCGYRVSLDEAAELQPVLKEISEKEGELSPDRVLEIFRHERVNVGGQVSFMGVNVLRDEGAFQFRYKIGEDVREERVVAEGPIEACLILMREAGFPVQLKSYNQSVVPATDPMWSGRALSEIELEANGHAVTGRGVSSDTLVANMKALFGGVNLLYRP